MAWHGISSWADIITCQWTECDSMRWTKHYLLLLGNNEHGLIGWGNNAHNSGWGGIGSLIGNEHIWYYNMTMNRL